MQKKKGMNGTDMEAGRIFDTHAHYDDEAFDEDRDHLLEELPRGEYPDADAILAAYERIEALDESLIPADSLIREFIGGGSFSY